MPFKTEKILKNQKRIPKQARALLKYHRVLDACSRVLATHGYAKTTMTEIALESDLPYATIYQYFDNKQDVFAAWFDRMSERLFEQLVRTKELNQNLSIEDYVELLIKSTLLIVSASKETLHQLFYAIPHLLTSKIISTIEEKAVRLTTLVFNDEIKTYGLSEVNYSVKILTKMINGYITQLILEADAVINVEKDSAELSLIVNLYLKTKINH